jgi:hypothetical protein
MADQKISAMPAAATLDGTEITPIVQTGVNKQVSTGNYVSQVLDVTPVKVNQGGTGVKTLTGYVYGNGTGNFTNIAIGGTMISPLTAGTITGQTLYWNGTSWTANVNLFNNGTNVFDPPSL